MKKYMQNAEAHRLSRTTQKNIRGGVITIFYKCVIDGECYPSAFQCGKGCPGGSSKCVSVFIDKCVF
jgi:hypothetical protein